MYQNIYCEDHTQKKEEREKKRKNLGEAKTEFNSYVR
jgi:hypothetical protein